MLQWLSPVLPQIPEAWDSPLAVPLAARAVIPNLEHLSVVQVDWLKVLRVFGCSLPAPTQRVAPLSCPTPPTCLP